MKVSRIRSTCAFALLGAGFAATPVSAVELAVTGDANPGNLSTVTGDDHIGGTSQMHHQSDRENSHFAMADFLATPQLFNIAMVESSDASIWTDWIATYNHADASSGLFQQLRYGVYRSIAND